MSANKQLKKHTDLTWSSGEHSSLGRDSIRKSMSLAVLAIRVANKAACPKSKPLSLFHIIQSLKEGNFGCYGLRYLGL